MNKINSAAVVLVFGILAFAASVSSATAGDDSDVVRAYVELPFGTSAVKTVDPQMGLQLIKEYRSFDSEPIATFSDTTVLGLSFDGRGAVGLEVMGVDMVALYAHMDEGPALGQNATDFPTGGALIAGGLAGAAILCMTKTICDDNSKPKAQPCKIRFGLLGTSDVALAIVDPCVNYQQE